MRLISPGANPPSDVGKYLRSVRDFARKEWPFGQFG
jgi:hypothetical protein